MQLRWRNLAATYPAADDARAVVECCPEGERMKPRDQVIFAAVDQKDQKRGQPPFRYRCIEHGPTQEDFNAHG